AKLVHFHVHFRRLYGRTRKAFENVKGHHLPWEDEVLASRIPAEPGSRVVIASHEMELLLLLMRICLKQPAGALRLERESGVAKEFEWLIERLDRDAFAVLAERLIGSEAAGALRVVVDRGLNELEPHRTRILTAVERYRRSSRFV